MGSSQAGRILPIVLPSSSSEMYTYLYIVSIRTNVACPRSPGTCSPTSFTLEETSCIRVFFLIEEQIHAHRGRFLKEYGVVPEFKAGVHAGDVIIAQIGELKSEIVYNATSSTPPPAPRRSATGSIASSWYRRSSWSALPSRRSMLRSDWGPCRSGTRERRWSFAPSAGRTEVAGGVADPPPPARRLGARLEEG